jgi:Fe-S-cluster formation regulator IscX/YfhJ
MTWEDAVELCTEIVAELADLPERAENFVESVEEKVLSIQDWIEDNKHVTDKQIEALKNMHLGVQKWLR